MVMPVAERVTLGERVALLRKLRRLTQRELGDLVGTSSQTISNWERGIARVPSTDVTLLAEALNVTVTELFSEQSGEEVRSAPRDNPQTGDSRRQGEFFNVPPLEEPRPTGARPLPIYRWGSLGDPRDHESSPHEDRQEYPPSGRERLIGPNGFGVDVRGASMVGRDVHDGDVCWVNPDRPYRIGDMVLALVNDGSGESGMVIKTYARTEVGYCLLSETAEGKSTVACDQFNIIGPVVLIQRSFPPR